MSVAGLHTGSELKATHTLIPRCQTWSCGQKLHRVLLHSCHIFAFIKINVTTEWRSRSLAPHHPPYLLPIFSISAREPVWSRQSNRSSLSRQTRMTTKALFALRHGSEDCQARSGGVSSLVLTFMPFSPTFPVGPKTPAAPL